MRRPKIFPERPQALWCGPQLNQPSSRKGTLPSAIIRYFPLQISREYVSGATSHKQLRFTWCETQSRQVVRESLSRLTDGHLSHCATTHGGPNSGHLLFQQAGPQASAWVSIETSPESLTAHGSIPFGANKLQLQPAGGDGESTSLELTCVRAH